MVTAREKSTSQVRHVRRQKGRRRRKMHRNLFSIAHGMASHTEETFWRQLEEREEGRLAQEADHLFDTSFAWAA
jgi:hypothetical protein